MNFDFLSFLHKKLKNIINLSKIMIILVIFLYFGISPKSKMTFFDLFVVFLIKCCYTNCENIKGGQYGCLG